MDDIAGLVLALALEIQQIPAPTFHEEQRAEFVRKRFTEEGLTDVSADQLGNVFGRLRGKSSKRPLIVSAHLDTVFSLEASRPASRDAERIDGPGIGDNSLGVAALLGLLWMLRDGETPQPEDIWFVANVGEEGLGDLRGMKAVVDRFRTSVRAYLVIEGTALGHVYHRGVGVRRYRVTALTAGGHSWSDYGQPSAVHELASLVASITALRLPASPRTTLNVGLISGGTGINVVASEARFELDLRSESPQILAEVATDIEARVRAACRDGVELKVEVIGERPAGGIPIEHPLVETAGRCLMEQGLSPSFTSGSTDANIPLSLGLPAVVLGVTTGGGAHTTHEYINTAPVSTGMNQLACFVRRVLRDASPPAA